MKFELKHLIEDCDRHGNVRLYVRVRGCRKVRLRETPGTAEFMTAYEAALAQRPARGAAKGTFRAACEAYYASRTFAALDPSTRNWRRKALDRICEKEGMKPIAPMQPRHIRRLRDELNKQPVVANLRLKAIKALFKWAMEEDVVTTNPARDIPPLVYATSGHHSWTVEEVQAFEVRHPIGTKAYLAMALMLYTGGRREDAVRLGPRHVAKGRIRFFQAKNEDRTPVEVDVPVHPELAAAIATAPAGSKTFLMTEFGQPFTANGFGNWFADRCREAGVPGRAHGLRKALAARLAENGATTHEIMAWTGHSRLEEVETYTRAALKRTRADAGLAKLTAKSVPPRRLRGVPLSPTSKPTQGIGED